MEISVWTFVASGIDSLWLDMLQREGVHAVEQDGRLTDLLRMVAESSL